MLYVLINKKNGVIMRMEARDTSDGEYSGNVSYTLNESKGAFFVAESEAQAKKVIRQDSHWYNSSSEHPCHGNVKVSELEVKELVYSK